MKGFRLAHLATVIAVSPYLAAILLPWAAMDLGSLRLCPTCLVPLTYAKVYLVQLVGAMLLSPARTDSTCALSLGLALTLGTVQIVTMVVRVVTPSRSRFFLVTSSLLVATCLVRFRSCLELPRLGWTAALGGSLALLATGGVQGLMVWRERRRLGQEIHFRTPRLAVIWKDRLGSSVSGILVEREGRLEVLRGSEIRVRFPERPKLEYDLQRTQRHAVFRSVVGRSMIGGLAVVVVIVWAMLDVQMTRSTTELPVPEESLAFAGLVLVVAVIAAVMLLFTEETLLARGFRVTVATPECEELGSFDIERWQLESLLDVAARVQVTVSPRSADDPSTKAKIPVHWRCGGRTYFG